MSHCLAVAPGAPLRVAQVTRSRSNKEIILSQSRKDTKMDENDSGNGLVEGAVQLHQAPSSGLLAIINVLVIDSTIYNILVGWSGS